MFHLSKKPPKMGGFVVESESLLLGSLGKGADSAGRKLQFHATKTLGLEVDLEGTTGSNVRVTTRVPCLGSTSCHLANSAHRDKYKD